MEEINYSKMSTMDLEELGTGLHATVYKYKDIAIKAYNNSNVVITKEIFEALKEIKLNAFLDLIDCAYYPYFCLEDEYIKSYSYKYVDKSDTKCIDMPLEYTLNSLYELEKVMKRLNELKIKIIDAHGGNCIPTNDNIVIIDPDRFEFSSTSVEINNLKQIKRYVYDLWINECEHKLNNAESTMIMHMFDNESIDECITNFSKKVREKTPRDVIDKCLSKGYIYF